MTAEVRRRFGPLFALILPVGLVKAVALVIGAPGPAIATAEPALAPPPVGVTAPAPPLDASQEAALARVAALASEPFPPSPMFTPAVAATQQTPEPVLDLIQPLEVIVRGIMQTEQGSFALIEGYLYSAGQSIRGNPEWKVDRIEADRGTVVFVNDATGHAQILSVRETTRDDG